MSDERPKYLHTSDCGAWPSAQVVKTLLDHPAYSAREAADFAGISEQRLAQWVTRKKIEGATEVEPGRRLWTLRQVLEIACIEHLVELSNDLETAVKAATKFAVHDLAREWMEAAADHDRSRQPPSEVIRQNVKEHGYTYYIQPDPFAAIGQALDRLKYSMITLIQADKKVVQVSRDYPMGEALASAGPILAFDGGSVCSRLLPGAVAVLQKRVLITVPNVPEQALKTRKSKA